MQLWDLLPLFPGRRLKIRDGVWRVQCPGPNHAHGDEHPSLDVANGDKGLVLQCRSGGCTAVQITAAIGITLADLFYHPPSPHNGLPTAATASPEISSAPRPIVAVYPYVDPTGTPLYEVVRFEPKDFRQRRPDGHGGWIWDLKGVTRTVYRQPDLVEQLRVFWCEGEKDADRLATLGLPATTACGGTGGWRDEYADQLVQLGAREVIVLPDHDEPGEAYARDNVARGCRACGLEVRILRLPGLGPKGDVSDWLDAGHTGAELVALAGKALAEADNLASRPVLAATSESWPEPKPLPTSLPSVPAFSPDRLLPPALRGWVVDIAERAQCPLDFVAATAIVGLAGVVGRQLAIRPKRHDDWTVVPNLWGLVIGRPGMMKTPAMQEALRPLKRLVAEAQSTYEAKRREHEFLAMKAQQQKKLLEKRIRKALETEQDTEPLRAQLEALTVVPPTECRYIVNDSTVEKLGVLLNENPTGLLLERDEVGGFLRTMEREGHQNDRAFYCEAWNGTSSYVYDRIGRGTLKIEAACLSIISGWQPGPLAAYLAELFRHGETDDGLIQRFQVMVYPDSPPAWRNVDRWPNTEAKNTAYAVYQRLAKLYPEDLAAQCEAAGALPFLHFTEEAQALFDTWRARLEAQIRDPEEHPAIVAHLSKYRSLMPSLALLLHLVECVERGQGGPVTAVAAEQADAWCRYLEAHARRVYHSVTVAAERAMVELAQKLTAGALPNPFRAREVCRKQWSGLTEMADVLGAIDWLIELHWVRRIKVRPTNKGGASTSEYHVNPKVIGSSG